MTEATGAGVGLTNYVNEAGYTCYEWLGPGDLCVAIRDGKLWVETGSYSEEAVPSEAIDWLIDTLVLAKEQVQGE